MPVMRDLLTSEELGTVNVSIREFPDGSPQTGDIPIGKYDWTLFFEVYGGTLFEPLVEPITDEEITSGFYEDLPDWISETNFGWGQL